MIAPRLCFGEAPEEEKEDWYGDSDIADYKRPQPPHYSQSPKIML